MPRQSKKGRRARQTKSASSRNDRNKISHYEDEVRSNRYLKKLVSLTNKLFQSGLPRLLTKFRSQRDASLIAGFSLSDDGNKICMDCFGYKYPRNDGNKISHRNDGKKKYFEIISRFFMASYIIIVDFMGYIITNYLREDNLKNDLWSVSLNCLENVFLKLENISLDFLENVSLNYLENYSLANFCGMNNFIKLNDFERRHLRDDFLFNRKINSKKI